MSPFALPAPVLVVVLTWFIAQTMKVISALVRKQHSYATYLAPGGMPSVHSAVFASLATIILIEDGWRSTNFALSIALVGFIVFDAVVVRQQSGRQAQLLNRLQDEVEGSKHIHLKEIVGHRPREILAGFALGIGLALLLAPAPSLG